MFGRNTLVHLRIPFSFFLLPIYAFALSQADPLRVGPALLIFGILHLFIYPASNAYNSFQDRDEGPIGLLKTPPPVTRALFWLSLVFELAGIALSFLLGWAIALQVAFYGLVSRAYSWHGIRLKKYPWGSFAVVALVQGGYTYLLVFQAITGKSFAEVYGYPYRWAALATALLTGAMYPLTQIYQHREDARRGDRTLSLLLGVRGTFVFSGAVFVAALTLLGFYFISAEELNALKVVLLATFPVALYFLWWASSVWNRPARIRYEEPMRLNLISATLLTLAFLWIRWG